jgi:RecB family endonuclease NucS
MMEITILSAADIRVREKDIQNSFERNLALLDEDLEFVASEVVIGTGRIDTLAYDSVNGRSVFIEYKGPEGFGKDALIQLMDYPQLVFTRRK